MGRLLQLLVLVSGGRYLNIIMKFISILCFVGFSQAFVVRREAEADAEADAFGIGYGAILGNAVLGGLSGGVIATGYSTPVISAVASTGCAIAEIASTDDDNTGA